MERTLDTLRTKSRDALSAVKRAARRGLDMPLHQAIDYEVQTLFAYIAQSPDMRKGLQAFLDKRPATF